MDIFRVDWILVDAIIIIFLILFLIFIKLYKYFIRWRSTLTNSMLEVKDLEMDVPLRDILISAYYFKNVYQSNEAFPTIIMLIFSRTKRFSHALAEGISTYGFNVIILRLKKKPIYKPFLVDQLCSKIIDILEVNNLNPSFITISIKEKNISFSALLSQKNYLKHIAIKPSITISHAEFADKKSLEEKRILIFNDRSFFFFKNKNIKKSKEMKIYKRRCIVIHGSKRNFRYYETMLLSTLLMEITE
jgi:hypothetical protein